MAKPHATEKRAASRREALLSILSGAVAEPVAGLAGLYGLATGGVNKGAQNIESTRNALTYKPRDPSSLESLGAKLAPITDKIEAGKRYLGDGAMDKTGSPGMATAAYMLPDVALTLLGARGAGVKGPTMTQMAERSAMPTSGSAAAQRGAIGAWHGSPHDFDKFSMDKLGTGEGAQAYGHGLYFAGDKGVASGYRHSADWRTKSSNQLKYNVDGETVSPKGVEDGLLYNYRMSSPELFEQRMTMLKDDVESSLAASEKYTKESKISVERDDVERYLRMAEASKKRAAEYAGQLALGERLRSANVAPATGRLYDVELAPDEADLLDWDVPLHQQPENVQRALGDFGWAQDEMTGGEFYRALGFDYAPSPAEASKRLRELGVPGVRYLDGGSRAVGDGSRNYVMFDDSLVKIRGKE